MASYNKATDCHICGEQLVKYNALDAMNAYNPFTGEYAGRIHNR